MKLTVIGAGNMGGALIHGWAKSGKVGSITISDKNEALLASFKEKYPSITTTTDNVAAVKDADVIVVVVKPWLMPLVLGELKPVLDLKKQIVVSDAANFTTDKLAETLGTDAANFFYVIHNIAAEFGASMSFIAKGSNASQESLDCVKSLYDICGDTLVVTENLVGPGMMMASCGYALHPCPDGRWMRDGLLPTAGKTDCTPDYAGCCQPSQGDRLASRRGYRQGHYSWWSNHQGTQ